MAHINFGLWDGERFYARGTYTADSDLLPSITHERMTRWIDIVSVILGQVFRNNQNFIYDIRTAIGAATKSRISATYFLFNPEQFEAYESKHMIHIAVLGEPESEEITKYQAFYIVQAFSDILDEHMHACTLLDAAAADDGNANVKGVGSKMSTSFGDVYYFIHDSFITGEPS